MDDGQAKNGPDQASGFFLCNVCGTPFSNKADLSRHLLNAHSPDVVAFCEKCFKGFKSLQGYKNHMKLNHSESKKDCPQCQYCGKYWPSSSSLKSHERSHTGERPFSCNICGKSYRQKRDALGHKCKKN